MTDPAIQIEGLRFAWNGAKPVLDVPAFTLARGERLFPFRHCQ